MDSPEPVAGAPAPSPVNPPDAWAPPQAAAPAEPVGYAPGPVPAEPPAPRRSRRALVGWLVGVGVAVLVAGGVWLVHSAALSAYDDAADDLTRAAASGADAAGSLDEAVLDTRDGAATGDEIVQAAADDLVDPAARDAFSAAIAASTTTADTAQALLDGGVDDGGAEEPFWTWELFTAASDLEERADAAEAVAAEMATAEDGLEDAADSLGDAATALYTSATPAAAALEAANVSARTLTVLDLREAAQAVAGQTDVGSGAAVAFATYAQRAQAIKESAASELAEKAGPLLTTRLEIEEYARSIAGGVVLDFDWAPVVAGVGGPNGIGGTATWNTGRGGFSTITLSNSVAEWWPNADSRALVAHEVGHSITSKCHTLFDSADQAANEEWATAWAISMGHTATGNGVQAYGYPSQAMIDIAATCR